MAVVTTTNPYPNQNAFHQINAGAQSIYNLSPEERYETAQQYFNEGYYTTAMQLYQNYPANGPHYLTSFSQVARCLYLLGEYENALSRFKQIDPQMCKGLNFNHNFTGLRNTIGINRCYFSCEKENRTIDPRFASVSSDVINHLIYSGEAYGRLSFYTEALTQYKKALWLSQEQQLEGMNAICGILIAKTLIKLNVMKEAEVYFTGAKDYYECWIKPFQDNNQKIQFLNAYSWCVSKFEQLKKPENFNTLYQGIPDDHPSAIYHLRKLALECDTRSRKIEQLERVLQLARRFFPHHPYIAKIYRDLGQIYSDLTEESKKRELYQQALTEWKHQIKHLQNIDEKLAYYQLGKLEQLLGRNLSAFNCFERALVSQNDPIYGTPLHKKIRDTRNALNLKVHDNSQRIQEFRVRGGVESLNMLVETLCKHLEIEDEAFNRLSLLIEQADFQQYSPEIQVRCLRNLGCIRSNQERHEEAVTYFLQAKGLYAKCTLIHCYDVLYRLADSLVRLNRHVEAIDYYAQAVKIRPTTQKPRFDWTHRPPEDALKRLEGSLKLVQGTNPPSTQKDSWKDCMKRAAENLLERGHYEQAQICLKMALKWSDEARFEIWLLLGKCYEAQEDFFQALSCFNLILSDGNLDQRNMAKNLVLNILRALTTLGNDELREKGLEAFGKKFQSLNLEIYEEEARQYEADYAYKAPLFDWRTFNEGIAQDVQKESISTLSDTMINLAAFNITPPLLPHYLAKEVCEDLIRIGFIQNGTPRGIQSLNQALQMGNDPFLMQVIVFNGQLCNFVLSSKNDQLRASLKRAQSDAQSGRNYLEELRKVINQIY